MLFSDFRFVVVAFAFMWPDKSCDEIVKSCDVIVQVGILSLVCSEYGQKAPCESSTPNSRFAFLPSCSDLADVSGYVYRHTYSTT